MRKHLTILLALALIGGSVYGSSSPPAHAPTGLKQKEKISTNFPVTEPIAFVAMPEFAEYVADATITYQGAPYNADMAYTTRSNVSVTADGHAINKRVATGLTMSRMYAMVNIKNRETCIIVHSHIDPGRQV